MENSAQMNQQTVITQEPKVPIKRNIQTNKLRANTLEASPLPLIFAAICQYFFTRVSMI
jgi:hypothetical protein